MLKLKTCTNKRARQTCQHVLSRTCERRTAHSHVSQPKNVRGKPRNFPFLKIATKNTRKIRPYPSRWRGVYFSYSSTPFVPCFPPASGGENDLSLRDSRLTSQRDGCIAAMQCVQCRLFSALARGCCAALSSSDNAAPGGRKVTHPNASKKVQSGKLRCCAGRCRKTEGWLRDNASAHVFFSPARRRFAAHAAANFRQVPSGSAVLHSLSKPASVGALSEAAGKVNDQCRAEHALCASIASASWPAFQSKQCIAAQCLAIMLAIQILSLTCCIARRTRQR